MYPIQPPAVFAHESVMNEPRYRAGVERVVAALTTPRDIETFTDDDLPALVRDRHVSDRRVPMGTLDTVEDPVLVFNTFRFADESERRARQATYAEQGLQVRSELLGLEAFHWANYNQAGDPAREHKVCRPCWRIHLQRGCLHRCLYCGLGGMLTTMVNVDEYWVHLQRLMELHPWQKTFLLDDDADPPGLEPELGALGELIEYFGTQRDRYLIIHTKTWNTDWLRNLRHNGQTILVWSLSAATQSREIEPRAGTTEQRIEAARVAEAAGYPIRYKFKPIIPVRNWRQEASDAVALALERTHPDVISLCTFMWMDVNELKRRLAPVLDLLDPELLAQAEAFAPQVENPQTQPYPDDVRAAIYDHYLTEIRKHAPDLPVSLSTESFQMWRQFREKLRASATDYVCGCGPMAVPGAKRLDCNAFTTAVRTDRGQVPGTYPAWAEPA